MRTLKELIISARCRKGPAAGIDGSGEWWQAGATIKTSGHGGDGVGNSAPSVRCDLQMRHYRNGTVVVGVLVERWHQNTGTRTEWVPMPGIEESQTTADVVASLRRWNEHQTVLREFCRSGLTDELGQFGLLAHAPAPDEEAVAS